MRSRTDVVPTALAGALALLALALGWRGADWPAQLLRVELVESAGAAIWNNHWFAGHHTPAYGIVFPVVASVFGAGTVAVASCTAAAWCFHDIARVVDDRRALAASAVFAAGTVVNVAVGRLTFALGLAVALSALAALHRGRPALAGAFAVATAPASPVAGVMLALVLTVWALHVRRVRPAVFAALGAAPVVVSAVVFPQGGQFPFRAGALAWSLVVAAVVASTTAQRVVRIGAALYSAACLATFLVANPLGANATRIGMFLAAPVVALTARRPMTAAIVLPALLWWQWSPALDGIVRAGRDPSSAAEYHQPLVDAVRSRQDGAPVRLEVVPTQRHWETVHVASELPLARGWERQLDMGRNPLFYGTELDAEAYHAWLREHAVQFVALADVPVDPSGALEAELLGDGLPFLEFVWRDEHWRLWRVIDATPLIDGPGRLVRLTPAAVVLDVDTAAPVLVRVRWSGHWSLDRRGCVMASADGWTIVHVSQPGRVTLRAALLGGTPLCQAGPMECSGRAQPHIRGCPRPGRGGAAAASRTRRYRCSGRVFSTTLLPAKSPAL